MHLGQEHLLVIGAVEDHQLAAAGCQLVGAPQEMMGFLFRGRFFEGRNSARRRIGRGEDVADGDILAGGVHALQDDEDAVRLSGEHQLLQLAQLRRQLRQKLFGLNFVEAAVLARINPIKLKRAAKVVRCTDQRAL